jgi:fermentation-respiration switch protein FrsA (DUF1100 family)
MAVTDRMAAGSAPRGFSARRIIAGLVLLCVLGVIGLCASVLAVGLWLAWPSPAAIGPPPLGLAGAEPVQIQSASGSVLRGWWLQGSQPGGGAVVLMHGVHANRMSMVRRASILHQHGFAVLLFDFQAHGESPGRLITFGHLEALDAAAAVAFVRQHLPNERIGAIGVSLGGAAALLGSAPRPVDALVLESVYPDIDAALSDRLRASLGAIAGPVLTPVLRTAFETLLPPVLGVGLAGLRPIDHIGGVTAPILIASGIADDHTTIAETRAMFARAAEPKQFWAVPGAAHVDLEQHDPVAYWGIVLPFLTQHLQQDGR